VKRTSRIIVLSLFAATALAGCGKPGNDLVLLRDGNRQGGTLRGCTNSGCALESQAIPQAAIAWIGFSVVGDAPPAVRNPAGDEIHLRNGSIESGHLVGISDSKVVTDRLSYERKDVAWIHLVPPASRPPSSGEMAQSANDAPGKGQDDPGTPPKPPSPPPPPPTKADPPHGGPNPPATGEMCNFWLGNVRARSTSKIGSVAEPGHSVRTTTYRARLREGARISQASLEIPLINVGSIVEGSLEEEVTGRDSSRRTSGSGKATVSNPGVTFGTEVFVVITPSGERVGYRFALEADWESRLYGITTHGVGGYPPRSYVQEGKTGFEIVHIGVGSDPVSPRRIAGGGRSMEGDYTVGSPGNDYNVSWNLRAVTAPCLQPPPADTAPPAPAKDPCGDTSAQDSQWHLCLDHEKLIESDISRLTERQREEAAEARLHAADFKLVKNLCKLWDKSKDLLEAIIGGPEFAEGLSPADAAEFKEFQETIKLLTEMAGKLADGKNPAEALEPEEVKDWIERSEKLNKLIAQADTLLAGDTARSGAAMLEECSAPIPDALQRSAEQYVEHLKASLDALHDLNVRLNDLRSKDLNDCLPKQFKAYAACVQHARCAGTPESACADKKPPGNWPEVR
jgi:hypothetical protein